MLLTGQEKNLSMSLIFPFVFSRILQLIRIIIMAPLLHASNIADDASVAASALIMEKDPPLHPATASPTMAPTVAAAPNQNLTLVSNLTDQALKTKLPEDASSSPSKRPKMNLGENDNQACVTATAQVNSGE